MNLRPSGYEPDELPGCSTPHQGAPAVADVEGYVPHGSGGVKGAGRSVVDSVGESPVAAGLAIAGAGDGEVGDELVAGPVERAKSCRSLRNLRGRMSAPASERDGAIASTCGDIGAQPQPTEVIP